MNIRLLTPQDGPAYQQLRLQALQTDPDVFLATYEQESQKHEQSFAQEIEFNYHPPTFGYYGAFQKNDQTNQEKLVGFLQISPSFLPKQTHIAFLFNLYIAPEERGKNKATALWEHVVKQLRKHTPSIERIFLSCIATNEPALELYQKIGFTQYGTRRQSVKWHNKHEDEIEMVLVIS